RPHHRERRRKQQAENRQNVPCASAHGWSVSARPHGPACGIAWWLFVRCRAGLGWFGRRPLAALRAAATRGAAEVVAAAGACAGWMPAAPEPQGEPQGGGRGGDEHQKPERREHGPKGDASAGTIAPAMRAEKRTLPNCVLLLLIMKH